MEVELVLKVGGKEVRLTEEEARELYTKLHAFFGSGYPFTTPWVTYPEKDMWTPFRLHDYGKNTAAELHTEIYGTVMGTGGADAVKEG